MKTEWIDRFSGAHPKCEMKTNRSPREITAAALLLLAALGATLNLQADAAQRRVANTTLKLPSSPPGRGIDFPQTLAETGAFADLLTLTANPGIVPYNLNVPLWSDGAQKTRWFCVPDSNARIEFSAEGHWSFPNGTVWIKHFELELTNGVPESARRLETRFLVQTAAGFYGVTYRWDDSKTNAVLAPEEGLDETFQIHEVSGVRSQVWHYPSRSECLVCHNPTAGSVLGFNTGQLNRDLDCLATAQPHRVENQLRALDDAGYFTRTITNFNALPALASASNEAVSREYRVRSFLSANCVHCHQRGAPCGYTSWNALISNSLPDTGLINGLVRQDFGDRENRAIKPGDPAHSIILIRMIDLTPGIHMPPIATSVLNTEAVELITAWVREDLLHYQSFEDWQLAHFGSDTVPHAGPSAVADLDGGSSYLKYLTGGDPLATDDAVGLAIRPGKNSVELHFVRVANCGYEVQWTTDLTDPNSWKPLDVPANRPFFSAVSGDWVIEDPDTRAPFKFYRLRLYQP